MPGWKALLTATTLAALLSAPATALAGAFNVAPTRVTLGAKQHTSLLTIHNTGTEPLRFQVKPYRWDQQGTSDMVLAPTDDIVVYPTLLTVAPGESRRLRVGTTASFGDTEGAYRLFVEELPPLDLATGAQGVRVLTRAGIPVFVAPTKANPRGAIADAHLDAGTLDLAALNQGNVHVMLQELDVTGKGPDGKDGYTAQVRGWYVLPGRSRHMSLAIPTADCVQLKHLDIRAVTDQGTWTQKLAVTPEQCGG